MADSDSNLSFSHRFAHSLATPFLYIAFVLFVPMGNRSSSLDAMRIGSPANRQSIQLQSAAEQLRHGQMPLFNPQLDGGQPLLEQGRPGVFSSKILPYLIFNPARAELAALLIPIGLAGIGMWLVSGWIFSETANRNVMTAIYGLGLFAAIDLAAWLPLCMFGVRFSMEKKTPARLMLAVLILANQFLFGDIALSMTVVCICFLFCLPVFLYLPGLTSTNSSQMIRRPFFYRRKSADDQAKTFSANSVLLELLYFAGIFLLSFSLAGVQWVPMLSSPLGRKIIARQFISPDAYIPTLFTLAALCCAGFIPWILGRLKLQATSKFALQVFILIAAYFFQLGFIHRLTTETHPPELVNTKTWAIYPRATTQPTTPASAAAGDADIDVYCHKSVWTTRKVRWNIAATLPEAVAKNVLVQLHDDLPEDSRLWLDRMLGDRKIPRTPESESLFSQAPKLESAELSGSTIHIRSRTGGTGWLIVPMRYAQGWTAHSKPVGLFGAMALTRNHPVVPATFPTSTVKNQPPVMAVPLEISAASDITLEYRPASFKRGVLTSSLATVILLLSVVWPMITMSSSKTDSTIKDDHD